MFRQRALVKLQSPEQLDEPQKMMQRKVRLAYATLGAALLAALVWALAGRVPVEGMGRGLLITPGSVKTIQAQATGQILQWYVSEGQFVEKDAVLGILDQPQIALELEQDIAKREELLQQNSVTGALRDRYAGLQKEAVETKRRNLLAQIGYMEDYIAKTRDLAAKMQQQNLVLLDTQAKNLKESSADAALIEKKLADRLASYQRLNAEKLVSDDQLREIRRDHEDAKLKIQELALKAQELQLNRVELNESYLNIQNLLTTRENDLTNLQLQLRELDNTLAQLDKSDSQFKFQQKDQIHEIDRSIERNRKRLRLDREIRSDFAGRILELSAAEGHVVNQGQEVAQIDTRREGDALIGLAFFQAKEGKQLYEGLAVRVSPSPVDKKRYGSIQGTVASVSGFPVTLEAVSNLVGNRSVAQQLTADGFNIEVHVKLVADPRNVSGYRWTSLSGPDVNLTAGTSVEVWATVERRRPLSYLLPKLKKWGAM